MGVSFIKEVKKRMQLKEYKYIITFKMQNLSISEEAKIFYLINCDRQDEYIKTQQNKGIDPPKIQFDEQSTDTYGSSNELTNSDMISIVEELEEIGVLDED